MSSSSVSPLLKQAWVASAVLLTMVGQGMLFSYTSCLLPALRQPDSLIKVDLYTGSWIASSVGVAGILGFFLSSFFMVYWGRRIAYGLILLPGIVGWILIYFAYNVQSLLVGRIFGGITCGASHCLGSVVLGEYTSPKDRGMFLTLKTTAVCLGGMFVHIIGSYLSWRAIALIALIPHVLALLIVLTWPESPAWLASKKQFDKCESAFIWLRGKDEDSIAELDELIKAQMSQTNYGKTSSLLEITVEFFKKFTRKDFIMPIAIIFIGAVLIEVCGRHLFSAYALDIVEQITGNKSQSFYYTLALDIVITGSVTFSSFLVKKMKRRTLLLSSGSAALVALTFACIYLFLVSKGIISRDRQWIPIGFLLLYFILVNLGCTAIPLAYLGEMLPLAHRGAGAAVGGIIFPLTLQAGLQIPAFLLESVKVHGTFAVLGVGIAICLVIIYYIVPETKDRTLQEIENYFVHGRFRLEDNLDDKEVIVKMLDRNKEKEAESNLCKL